MSQRLFADDVMGSSRPGFDAPHEARKAALVFHALSAEDRAWILANLPSEQGRRLQSLAKELETLGIPSDPGLVQEVISRGPAQHGGRSTARSARGTHRDHPATRALEGVEPARLAHLLSKESPGLIAYLLDGHAWPWEVTLLRLLDAPLRSEVEIRRRRQSGGSAAIGPVTWSRLVTLLMQRAEAVEVQAEAAEHRSGSLMARALGTAGRWWKRIHPDSMRGAHPIGMDLSDSADSLPRTAGVDPNAVAGES